MFNKTVLIFVIFNLLSLTNGSSLTTHFNNVVGEKSTLNEQTITEVWQPTTQLSPYDHIFRSVSEREGNDWRLLCAMAYHESRFRTDVVSHCGARGIMQIMPRVATQFDITKEELNNVEPSIYVANKLIILIDDMLCMPISTPEHDRIAMTLAAYNCGVGRIADARRLAKSFGENPNSWSAVSSYLTKMNDPEYYQMKAVKYGKFTGARQTNAYVNNVVEHYQKYCLLAMR